MSKTKRLLSVTLAIAMIILSAFSAFAEDTETVVETVGAMSVAAVSIENDDTTFDVNVKIYFNEVVTGPHNIITLTCDKFNLTNVELGDVAYTYTGSEEVPDIGTVQLPQGEVTIAEDGVKNANWATGKVLIEAPVDGTAPLVSEINLTATFTLKADVALGAGETLNIAVANDDMADANEAKLSISSGASVVTVHGAGTTYGYDETNHWLVCAVEGCTEHTYNLATHNMSEYVVNENDTTKQTATCTDNCGYSHTKDAEVVEPVITMAVGAKSDFQIGAMVTYTYDGELTHKGVLVYAGSYDESTVGISTAKAYKDFSSLTTTNYIYFQGFSLDNAVNVDYTIIPYVRNNDVYYYGDPVTYNYAKDFCVERLNSSNATTKERVIAILNTYYAITGTPAYEGQPAVTLPEVDASLLYTCTVPETYVERDFESNTEVTGNTQINFMLKPELSNYTGTVVSKGIVVMKPSVYTEGARVEVDGVNISSPWSSGYLKLTGMNIQNIGKNYAFATYVVDENSNYYYGTQIMSSYAKYLVDKLNNATNKLETAQKAMMILNLYKTVYGSDLYTTTTAQ